MHAKHFPGETPAYQARDELRKAELEPRRRAEKVAKESRSLPFGGPSDWFPSLACKETECLCASH
jgi:predicted dithiol-disulfide oxidoreductase (DUF899 family)